MIGLYASTRFKRDLKALKNRPKDIALLQNVIDTLRIPEPLPPKNRDHSLVGDYSKARECHIKPDLLLIYRIVDDVLILERIGSHSDLFR